MGIPNVSKTTLRVGVMSAKGQWSEEIFGKAESYIRPLFGDQDQINAVNTIEELKHGDFDLAVVTGVCGSSARSDGLAALRMPCMAVGPSHCFHPFHAAFYRDLARAGGIVLPADDPEQIAVSLTAARARKALNGLRLLVVSVHDNEFRQEQIRTFAEGCLRHLGLHVINRSVAELIVLAGKYTNGDADRQLQRWYAQVLDGPGEMDQAHMRQVAKLYLAEKEMLKETGACGITVDDIGGFLAAAEPRIMPNVTYGPLVFEGFLAAEEGDIEVLATELLLAVGLGSHPTMSNLYLAYRDRFDALDSHDLYTEEMELADYRQCVEDNHITLAHFSASGVLPPNMMEESRYTVREALPAWPGQSMIVSTPKLGPVVLARLTPDASGVHLVSGEVTKRSCGDQYGWYRGRWFVRIPSVRDFIRNCQHPHYAIGRTNGNLAVLRILTETLLGLKSITEL